MNYSGIIVGAAVFAIIGICHPIVIKMEYWWGKRSWWVLLLAGVAFAAGSLFVPSTVGTTILGAAAFSCLWGIHEILAQEMRVLRGWFPENPRRSEYYAHRRQCLGELGKDPSHRNCRKSCTHKAQLTQSL